MYNVKTKELHRALGGAGNAVDLYRITNKKTNEPHYYFPDEFSTPYVLQYVQKRLDNGFEYVWGSLDEQKTI